jgi:hypothetical protein
MIRMSASKATRRKMLRASAIVAGAVAMAAASGWSDGARAQEGEPIRIGFSMALTGGLAGAGKPALIAMEIWRATTSTLRAACSAGRSSSSTTTTRPSPRTCRRFTRSS